MMSDRKRRLIQTTFLGAVIGLLLSQYQPLWGEPRQLRAEPWSPVRKTLAGPHMLALALAGLAVGRLIVHVRDE